MGGNEPTALLGCNVASSRPGPAREPRSAESFLSRLLAPVLNPLLPTRPTEITVRWGPANGTRLIIDPRNEKFYWAGVHEYPVQKLLTRILHRGAVFWDLGAHNGFFSCLASRLVGPDGRVLAFEPMPGNRRRLLEAVGRNGLTNVVVRNDAVGRVSGSAVLHAAAESTMWSLVGETGDVGIDVPCVTLDQVLREGASPPAVIKIDVEGAEVDVLAGAAMVLSAHRPSLVVEFHSEQNLAEARSLLPAYDFKHVHGLNWLLRPLEETAVE